MTTDTGVGLGACLGACLGAGLGVGLSVVLGLGAGDAARVCGWVGERWWVGVGKCVAQRSNEEQNIAKADKPSMTPLGIDIDIGIRRYRYRSAA